MTEHDLVSGCGQNAVEQCIGFGVVTVHRGARFTVNASKHRAYQPGSMHGVDAGLWHETTISESERVATVMVTGRPQLRAPELAGPPGFPGGRLARRAVPRGRFLAEFGDLQE